MIVVSIIAALVLLFSIVGGFREGAVKQLFTLLSTLIAVPVAGVSYQVLAGWLSFIPGENWENFIAFFVMMAVVSIVLYFAFILPGRALKKAWPGGLFYCVLGAIFSLVNAAIGMVVFALVLNAYPIIDWLGRAVGGSGVIAWLVSLFGFVQAVLPEALQQAALVVLSFMPL
jgi:uncharacterized membrane protein required for colicin V production